MNFNENEICGSEVCTLCQFPTINKLCVNTYCKAGSLVILVDLIKEQQITDSPLVILTSKDVDLNLLNQTLLDKLELFYRTAKENGYDIVITQGYRSIAQQDALFTSGRGVTNAKGGQSPHNYKVAFDIAVRINKKIDWTCTDIYNKLGEIGKQVGLEWGGDFKKPDRPHYQLANWRQYKK